MNQRGWEPGRTWTASKTRIPKAADGEIRRGKILESLKAGSEEIVVLCAGAGYGKTTVMAEWAQSHKARCCWYHLHESDNDVFRFLRGMAASFSNAAIGNPSDLNRFVKAAWNDFIEMSETFFFCCFSTLPKEDIYICLDSFEVITDERVQTFLLQFIEYSAGRVRFFFSARGGFPAFLAAALMRGQVREIGVSELCFEEWETELLLNHMTGKTLPRQVTKNVQEYTGGWPAGVVFAGRELKRGKPRFKDSPLFDCTYLYHYIFYEIFQKLSFDMQQFLLDISVLEKIEAAVCNYALKRTDAECILEYLVRENLFLTRSATEQNCYHCERIYAEFLRERLPASRREQVLLRAEKYHISREENAKEELFVECLGSFLVRGKTGELTWRTKKTKELFAFLFCEEGRRIERDIITERLWPEKPPEKAVILFHTTVSYLRKTLTENGLPNLLLSKNQTYAIDMEYIASDMDVLKRWHGYLKGDSIPEGENPEELLELCYRGYLYGEDYLWAGVYKEHVEQRYLWILKSLAERELAQKDFLSAAAYLGRAAEVDDCDISTLERLIKSLLLGGDVSGAKREYERLVCIREELMGQKMTESFASFAEKIAGSKKNFAKIVGIWEC